VLITWAQPTNDVNSKKGNKNLDTPKNRFIPGHLRNLLVFLPTDAR
jgi:hypothetical protein